MRQMFASNGHALAPEQIEQLLTSPQGKHLLRELRMGTGTGTGTGGTGTGIGGSGTGTGGTGTGIGGTGTGIGIGGTGTGTGIGGTGTGIGIGSTGTGGTGTGTGIGGTGIGGPSPAERDGIRRAVFAVLSTVLVAAFVNDAMSAAEKESVGEQAQRQAVVLSAQLEERLYVKSLLYMLVVLVV